MARDDDAWKRFREKEEEREAEARASLSQAGKSGASSAARAVGAEASRGPDSAQINAIIGQAEPLIEQINNLYNQFMAGVERLPPIEKRKQLDVLLQALQRTPKPTQAVVFRCSTLQAKAATMIDRWERMLRDLESGKIRRRTQGGAG